MEMSPTQFARYEKLWEQIRKQGGASADKVEALLEIIASYAPEKCPRGHNQNTVKPPAQIHIHQCPDCAKATVPTSKGELELGEAELERALCDCQISRPGERNTTSIPPATRRKVLARYHHSSRSGIAQRFQCQRPGCNHTGYLEAHYVVPRSQGGSNDDENLTCLCSACHIFLHNKNHGFRAKEPQPIYKWQSHPRPARLKGRRPQHQRSQPTTTAPFLTGQHDLPARRVATENRSARAHRTTGYGTVANLTKNRI